MNSAINVLTWVMYFIGLYFSVFWMYALFERYNIFSAEHKSSASRKPKRFPMVSVIIPAYNAASTIRDCLTSVIRIDYPREMLEIIVVNDGSTDKTLSVVSEIMGSNSGMRIKLMSQNNLGKGAALNNAIRECKGEFFACLDSDSFVEPEILQRMLFVFEEGSPDVAIVTPAMKVYRPRTLIQKFQRVEYLIALLFNRLLSHFDALYVAPGPFSLYRTDVVRKLGGFDERNLTEDQEIGYRMQKFNYRLKHCFDGYVYTVSPETIGQLFRQRSRWWTGSLLNFLKYKSLLLNPKYGHFGIFQLPFIMIGYLTVFLVVFFFFYFTILPWFDRFYEFYLVGFDWKTLASSFRLSFDVLRYDLGRMFILLTLLGFGLATFFLAHRSAREGVFKHGFLYLPLYFLFYYVLLAFIYVIAAVQLLVGRRNNKWLGKSI
ncbi:glycosyltransferase family 2 protein [Candidatus Woesearchaeota archaeon]|nr:glycosyltransferase family 2 protein [Candidatus Woesearchaeota archaeon]